MSDKKLLGIDIGSYRLKIVESDGGRIRKAVTVDLPDNLVKNGRIVAFAAMALFIRETLKKNKFRYKDCAVSLSQENYYARRVHLPLMTTALLDVNLPF
ncbi:MAG: pilus assembly protein PilM, partial [Lachnospiraceae bacterium]|nr:pilus assembly protein PilM [Lachnospiraceae bacterium]